MYYTKRRPSARLLFNDDPGTILWDIYYNSLCKQYMNIGKVGTVLSKTFQ